MTNPAKLYADLLANPGAIIGFRDFERLLVSFGWALQRTKGSHRHDVHPRIDGVFTVQPRGKDAVSYQVRAFLAKVQALEAADATDDEE